MTSFLEKIGTFYESTKIHEQIKDVDFVGLFTNPWFIVPFSCIILYMLYRQSFTNIVIIAILTGIWWFSGTDYMSSVFVDGHMQIDKILPIVFGGAAVIGLLVYLLFIGSD